MENSTIVIIVVVIAMLLVGGFIALQFYKKKNLDTLFEQIYFSAMQIPKKKKKAFLLLMFIDTLNTQSRKAKKNNVTTKLNNPKYVDFQMIKMTKILKDSSDVKDKTTKQALNLLKEYLTWEEKKRNAQ